MAKRVLDWAILDLFSAKKYCRREEKNIEIRTYQNVYKRSDFRYSLMSKIEFRHFSSNFSGIQNWRVPLTGKYRIKAAGAGNEDNGTFGAVVKCSINLEEAQVLQIAIGQYLRFNIVEIYSMYVWFISLLVAGLTVGVFIVTE